MTKIVMFEFAGREENLAVQRPHVERLLALYPEAEFHLWDLTRKASDQAYIREWAASHDQISYRGSLHPGHPMRCMYPGDVQRRRGQPPCRCMKHKPPYEKVWHYYRDAISHDDYGPETIFVKFDDDVLWMDTERFHEVLSFLETNPYSVASANVTNNVVCAKYEPGLNTALMEEFGIGDPTDNAHDLDWWALHTDPIFAYISHKWLLDRMENVGSDEREPFRVRPGEMISINFVAMHGRTLADVAALMSGVVGDEGAVDTLFPWIIPNFRVAHLTFGPQEAGLSAHMNRLRQRYAAHTPTPILTTNP